LVAPNNFQTVTENVPLKKLFGIFVCFLTRKPKIFD